MSEKDWYCENIKVHQSSMYVVAYSILRNDEDVKDAIQETICKSYEKLDSLKDKSKFKYWILKILTNTSLEIVRKRKNTCSLEEYSDLVLEEARIDYDTKYDLWNQVQALEYKYRTVIVLFYYEDLSIKDIARILKITTSNVKKRLERARHLLKEQLCREVQT